MTYNLIAWRSCGRTSPLSLTISFLAFGHHFKMSALAGKTELEDSLALRRSQVIPVEVDFAYESITTSGNDCRHSSRSRNLTKYMRDRNCYILFVLLITGFCFMSFETWHFKKNPLPLLASLSHITTTYFIKLLNCPNCPQLLKFNTLNYIRTKGFMDLVVLSKLAMQGALLLMEYINIYST